MLVFKNLAFNFNIPFSVDLSVTLYDTVVLLHIVLNMDFFFVKSFVSIAESISNSGYISNLGLGV
ncbi:hypothetical protein [uncultured Sneathia sp.]|uniref:hypothetical protein n=1 Tax=uncultured Sneathia sp. TaxID=278067 RepID=UPI002594F498|nr:hypothetical protein [uncultured Sneathia sp.]